MGTKIADAEFKNSCQVYNCDQLVFDLQDSALLQTFWNDTGSQTMTLNRPSAPKPDVSSDIDNICSKEMRVEICWRNLNFPVIATQMEHIGIDGERASYLTEEQEVNAFEEGSLIVVKNRVRNPSGENIAQTIKYEMTFSSSVFQYVNHTLVLPDLTSVTCQTQYSSQRCEIRNLPADSLVEIHTTLKPKASQWGKTPIKASISVVDAVNSVTDESRLKNEQAVFLFTPKWQNFEDATTADVTATALRNPFKGVLPVADGARIFIPRIEDVDNEFVLQINGYTNCINMHFGAREQSIDFTRKITQYEESGIKTGLSGLIIDPSELKSYQNQHLYVRCVGGNFFSSTLDLKLRLHKLTVAQQPFGTFSLSVFQGEPRYFKFDLNSYAPDISSLSQVFSVKVSSEIITREHEIKGSVHWGSSVPSFFENTILVTSDRSDPYAGLFESVTYPNNSTFNSFYVMITMRSTCGIECKYMVETSIQKPTLLTFGMPSTLTLDSGNRFFYSDMPVSESQLVSFNVIKTKGEGVYSLRAGAQRGELPWWNDYKSAARRIVAKEQFGNGKKFIRTLLPISLTFPQSSSTERTYFFIGADCSSRVECNPEVKILLGSRTVAKDPVIISGKKSVRSFSTDDGMDIVDISLPKVGPYLSRPGVFQLSIVPMTSGDLRPLIKVGRNIDSVLNSGEDGNLDVSSLFSQRYNISAYYMVDETGRTFFMDLFAKSLPNTRSLTDIANESIASDRDHKLHNELVQGRLRAFRDGTTSEDIFLSVSATCEPGTETCGGEIEYELGADSEPMQELKFDKGLAITGRQLYAHVFKVNLSEMAREARKNNANLESIRVELFFSNPSPILPNLSFKTYISPAFESAVKKQGVSFTSTRDIIKKQYSSHYDYRVDTDRRSANGDDVRYVATFMDCSESDVQKCFSQDFGLYTYDASTERPEPVTPQPTPSPSTPNAWTLTAVILVFTLVLTCLPFMIIALVFGSLVFIAFLGCCAFVTCIGCLACGAGALTMRDRKRYTKKKAALLANQYAPDLDGDIMQQNFRPHVPPQPQQYQPQNDQKNDSSLTPGESSAPPQEPEAAASNPSQPQGPSAQQQGTSGESPSRVPPPTYQPPPPPKGFTEHMDDLVNGLTKFFSGLNPQATIVHTSGPAVSVSHVGSSNMASDQIRRQNEQNRRMHDQSMRNHHESIQRMNRSHQENISTINRNNQAMHQRIHQQNMANIQRNNTAMHQRIHQQNMATIQRNNQAMHQRIQQQNIARMNSNNFGPRRF
eukprot:CAMPEP_0117443722 /NCGR_PEP_ID=MMETSP0759-20121206/4848_1 /TAXON_ID=63605 /ORGANISM="Percolomonas cosmopolitus, Strain WS" /LENGTH=1266 /DNA_ID=CAMNT_0005235719 /DNA_START=449 /DNA_END=4249 /DNA_ORIENTATION=-